MNVKTKQKRVTSLGNSLTASILHMMQCIAYFKQKNSPETATLLEGMVGEILCSDDKNITNQINFLFNAGLIDDKGGLTNHSKKLVVESLHKFDVFYASNNELYKVLDEVLEELILRSEDQKVDFNSFVDKHLAERINGFVNCINEVETVDNSIPVE